MRVSELGVWVVLLFRQDRVDESLDVFCSYVFFELLFVDKVVF